MKPVISSSRLAVLLSCTALLGASRAQNAADKPTDKPAAPPEAAPAAKPIDLKDPVAVVDGEKISKAQLQDAFDNAVKASGMDASKLTEDQQLAGYHKLLDDLIIEKLLKAKSADFKVSDEEADAEFAKVKKNFPDEAAFKKQLDQAGQTEEKLKGLIKDGLQQRKWIDSQTAGQVEVSDADAEKFYKENIKEFAQPDQVRASHILFMVPQGAPDAEVKKKEAAANAAYERAEKGEDFAKLAKELTEEPNGKERAGDLDFFSKEQMVPEFAAAAFSMKIGDISKPVKTQFGYHVIKVTDKKAASTAPFEQVKPQLVGYLKNQKQQAAVQAVIGKLRSGAKIENNLPEIKPAPPGAIAAPGAPQSTN
ncbi:MAG: peptidylprolyl isomerase [Terrimicrobiaceae bacterium]|nr:peptidylprolyl isomerase [Terrimicrobiaceae bacterium]